VPLALSGAGVNVAPAGRLVAVSEAMASPSGSLAVTVTVSGWSSAISAVAVTDTRGAWSGAPTVMLVTASPTSALEAVKVTEWEPSSPWPGVQLRMPDALSGSGVNVAPAGRPVAVSV